MGNPSLHAYVSATAQAAAPPVSASAGAAARARAESGRRSLRATRGGQARFRLPPSTKACAACRRSHRTIIACRVVKGHTGPNWNEPGADANEHVPRDTNRQARPASLPAADGGALPGLRDAGLMSAAQAPLLPALLPGVTAIDARPPPALQSVAPVDAALCAPAPPRAAPAPPAAPQRTTAKTVGPVPIVPVPSTVVIIETDADDVADSKAPAPRPGAAPAAGGSPAKGLHPAGAASLAAVVAPCSPPNAQLTS